MSGARGTVVVLATLGTGLVGFYVQDTMITDHRERNRVHIETEVARRIGAEQRHRAAFLKKQTTHENTT